MHDLLADLRYGARMLRKAPVSTAIAVVSLGFAIAINTSVFSVASAFLWNTFRWRAPEEIVMLYETSKNDDDDHGVSPGNYLDWKESSTHLAGLEAYHDQTGNLTGGDEPERIDVVNVTAGIFELLGTPTLYGRGFNAEDASAPGARATVITHSFFTHRLGGDTAALGSSLSVDGEPHTVVGVLRPDFDFLPADIEMFRLVDLAPRRHDRESQDYYLLGRLAPGSSKDDLVAEIGVIAERLAAEHPETNRGSTVHVETLKEIFPGKTDTLLQYILLAVAGLVLLIASANLVNLFLARGDVRRSEVALRFALGAGRARLGRQLVTESLLVAAMGGALGVVGSIYSVRAFQDVLPAMLPAVFHPKMTRGPALRRAGVAGGRRAAGRRTGPAGLARRPGGCARRDQPWRDRLEAAPPAARRVHRRRDRRRARAAGRRRHADRHLQQAGARERQPGRRRPAHARAHRRHSIASRPTPKSWRSIAKSCAGSRICRASSASPP